ncbi:MAG: DUF4968 domain-containing protein, partial [Actinobacteria bacterium]|nr:DUF4968 domain-containing protein [Actinomycetota bacterium]
MGEYEAVLQNQPVDVSEEFARQQNHFFIGSRVLEFDPDAASGKILWKGLALKQRVSYHQLTLQFEDYRVWEDLPSGEYEDDQDLSFSISFITPRTVRLRVAARPGELRDEPSLMLDGEPPTDDSWKLSDDGPSAAYEGRFGSVSITRDPVRFEFRDASGRLLTSTWNLSDTKGVVNSMPTPLSGIYHARASSFLEHNLYPLRYNKAVAEATREVTGNGATFARSAWAGSQRYPLHWGGDAEPTDGAMAGTLRGGLSLGLCGFSFWSHFIGGFSARSPENLYR